MQSVRFFLKYKLLLFFVSLANASKVYASAVAKTQKIWGAYLESIMKVVINFIPREFEAISQSTLHLNHITVKL